MTPDRWQQVKTILADAMERDDALERAVFVESSCTGDPLLKQEVEALLGYADKVGNASTKAVTVRVSHDQGK
jgi:hypothetical protein